MAVIFEDGLTGVAGSALFGFYAQVFVASATVYAIVRWVFLMDPDANKYRLTDPEKKLVVRVQRRHAGGLPEEAEERAAAAFLQHGLCVLQDAVEPQLVQRCAAKVSESLEACRLRLQELGIDMEEEPFSYREVVHRSKGRFDLQLAPPAPLAEPGVEDEAPWVPLVQRILGADARRLFTGVVASSPGAEAQDPHMDGCHLFSEAAVQCPPHCLTVFVPLIKVTMENGPTQYWPGSHRLGHEMVMEESGFVPELSAGSVVLFDYRLIHRGLPNRSSARRPVLYMVWARSWFCDRLNFPPQPLFPERDA